MRTTLLFARKLAALGLVAFDPPRPMRARAAYATAGLESRPVTGNAGPHGRDHRR